VNGGGESGNEEGEWPLVKEALEHWLREENFDESGMQKRRLEDIRGELRMGRTL